MGRLAVIAVLALAANLAIIAELEFGGDSELDLSGVGELVASVTDLLSEVFASDAAILGVTAVLGFLWVIRRLSRSKPKTLGLPGLKGLGRLPGSYRCSFPGCRRRLRTRWFQRHGLRRYCGKHAYFELEHSSKWASEDHGCDRFYVYILKLDGKPWMYVGQTRNSRRRVRGTGTGGPRRPRASDRCCCGTALWAVDPRHSSLSSSSNSGCGSGVAKFEGWCGGAPSPRRNPLPRGVASPDFSADGLDSRGSTSRLSPTPCVTRREDDRFHKGRSDSIAHRRSKSDPMQVGSIASS